MDARHHEVRQHDDDAGPFRLISESVAAGVVVVLSYLMVSRIHFRSFKDLRLSRKTIELALLIAGCWILVAMNGVDKALIFLVLIVAYIVLGVAETMLIMKRRFWEARQERLAQSQAAAGGVAVTSTAPGAEAAAVAEAPRDEDVLRELGAFDEDKEEK